MSRKRTFQVIKHNTPTGQVGGQNGNDNATKSGVYSQFAETDLDQRTKFAKALHAMRLELEESLGGTDVLSPQEKILLSRIVAKAARCGLFEVAILEGTVKADDDRYIAWANSLRLDLMAVGLKRRKKTVASLVEAFAQTS